MIGPARALISARVARRRWPIARAVAIVTGIVAGYMSRAATKQLQDGATTVVLLFLAQATSRAPNPSAGRAGAPARPFRPAPSGRPLASAIAPARAKLVGA